MNVMVKYSYYFPGEGGGLLVLLDWRVNQTKIAKGFHEITLYPFGKVTSLLGKKVFFSVIASTCLRTDFVSFTRMPLDECLGLYIVVMIAGIHILQEIFAIDMLITVKPSLNTIANMLCDCYDYMETRNN